MSILTRLLVPYANVPDPGNDAYYDNVEDSGIWHRGSPSLSPSQALRLITVFACVRYIAETLSCLPLKVYEITGTDPRQKDEAPEHPLWDLFQYKPNKWQTPQEFIEMLTGHAALRGNGFARIVAGLRGAASELIPLNPARMDVEQLDSTRLLYHYRDGKGRKSTYVQEEILHLRGFGSDGVVGLSPVALARDALGLAAAAERYGGRFFTGNARPSGVLEHPGKLGQPARERLRKDWQDTHAGEQNAHKVAVLEEGLKWHEVGIKPEEAQFLETRKYQRSEIASLWRVPPHKVGIMDNATFTNIEHQGIEAVMDCLLSWAVRWELACRRDLITDPDKFYVKFNLNALLRGDTAARYAGYATAHTTGWLNVNEIRALEELNPIPGGEEYMKPMNMAPVNKKPDEQVREEERAEPDALDARMMVFVADAANRIANHEIRELGKKHPKASADPAKFWNWCQEFYNEHKAYVSRILAPFDLHSGVAQQIIESGMAAWATDAAQKEFALWSAARAPEICTIMRRAYYKED